MPSALVAVAVNTYVSPLVSPLTVIGELGPLAVTEGAVGSLTSVAVTSCDMIGEVPGLPSVNPTPT